MKPWQHGIDLEELRELAAPFRRMVKPHTYGAFGLPKERDIAAAMKDGKLTWQRRQSTRQREGAVTAVALFTRLKAASQHKDFTGRAIRIERGDVLIRSLAWAEGAGENGRQLLGHFLDAEAPAVWWELHQECDELRELAEEAGFRLVATKVSAGSDVKTLWVGGRRGEERAAAVEPLDPAEEPGLSCLAADFLEPSEREAVLSELATWGERWASHYSSYNKRDTWHAFALHGFDANDPSFIIKPNEMSKQWKQENDERLDAVSSWTEAATIFPTVRGILARLRGEGFAGGELDRVRFMRLVPGGELARHADITDREAGVADDRVTRLHIPVVTNPAVSFTSWDSKGQQVGATMAEGSLWYLDQRKPHRAINEGEEDRVHLVVDLLGSEQLRQRISEGGE